jgi:hypothetical protein
MLRWSTPSKSDFVPLLEYLEPDMREAVAIRRI